MEDRHQEGLGGVAIPRSKATEAADRDHWNDVQKGVHIAGASAGHRCASPSLAARARQDEIRYSINLDHPVIIGYRDKLPDDLRREFLRVVEVIGASIPIDALFADTSTQPSQVAGQAMSRGNHGARRDDHVPVPPQRWAQVR